MSVTALQVRRGGGLDTIARIELPSQPPGAGEVRVRIHASSLNFHDYAVVSGLTGPTEDRIPLSDGAGVVLEAGPGVTEFEPGDHVVSTFFPGWSNGRPTVDSFDTVPGDGIDGFARSEVTMPTAAFTRAPSGYSHAEAATLTTAGVTAWRALFTEAALRPGQTVLVQGTGGVSIFALQFAKLAGATVIATTSADDKEARLKELGADHVINYRRNPEWGMGARAVTGGRGVDHVIEVGGAHTLEQSLIATATGGGIALIGVLSGVGASVPLGLALSRQVRIRALLVGSRRDQLDMIDALDNSTLRPVVDTSFAFTDLAAAFEYQSTGKHLGKIGISM